MSYTGIVKKWGNSPSVRLPVAIMKEASLKVDDAVEIAVEDGKIIIIPSRPKEYFLDALISTITNENIHERVNFGAAVGKELI